MENVCDIPSVFTSSHSSGPVFTSLLGKWVYMYNDFDMTRYSLETMLDLTGCVRLNSALLHRQKQSHSIGGFSWDLRVILTAWAHQLHE